MRLASVATALVLCSSALLAQEKAKEEDEPPVETMEETVVTATREARPESRVPCATNVVDAERIREREPMTAPDALIGEVGVVIQKTNLGGGSPIIRGRSGKDNLLLIDGQLRLPLPHSRVGHRCAGPERHRLARLAILR